MPRMSLELVVVAIVILVVALVILTIFGTGISPFGWFSSQKNLCIQQYTAACQSTGYEPSDWNVKKYKNSGTNNVDSCSTLAPGCSCNKDTRVVSGCT